MRVACAGADAEAQAVASVAAVRCIDVSSKELESEEESVFSMNLLACYICQSSACVVCLRLV